MDVILVVRTPPRGGGYEPLKLNRWSGVLCAWVGDAHKTITDVAA